MGFLVDDTKLHLINTPGSHKRRLEILVGVSNIWVELRDLKIFAFDKTVCKKTLGITSWHKKREIGLASTFSFVS